MGLRDYVDISNSTLSKLGKKQTRSIGYYQKICLKLECKIEDVVYVIPESQTRREEHLGPPGGSLSIGS